MESDLRVKKILDGAINNLSSSGIESSQLEAELLLQSVLGLDKAAMYLQKDRVLSFDEEQKFYNYVSDRQNRKPLEYIIGQAQFYGMWFDVTKDTLIPRPETEILVESVLVRNQRDKRVRIIDLGTGCGNVAVSLASNLDCRLYATDISLAALGVACRNVEKYGLVDKVTFFLSDWFDGLKILPVDIIICNPPYIASYEWEQLPPEVKDYEPRTALWGGVDGCEHYVKIIAQAGRFLVPKGRLIFEVGWNKAYTIKRLLEKSGDFSKIEMIKDYDGRNRIVSGERKQETGNRKQIDGLDTSYEKYAE